MVRLICSLGIALMVAGCDAGPECAASSGCPTGQACINGACIDPPCSSDRDCPSPQVCSAAGLCESADMDAGRDAGEDAGPRPMDAGHDADLTREDAGFDSSIPLDFDAGVDSGGVLSRRDAGFDSGSGDRFDAGTDGRSDAGTDAGFDAGTDAGFDAGFDAGTDAGTDAGPPCECRRTETQSRNCGVCGVQTRTCDGCFFGAWGTCSGSDSRCVGDAPYCRNDYCWGWRIDHEGGSGANICIDMDHDYIAGAGVGSLDVQVYGRPGASWAKDNAAVSCGGGYIAAESGVLDGSGRDTSAPFVYGPSDCGNGTLGRYQSRVRITDTGGRPAFFLPNLVVSNFYNPTCTSDRSSCSAAATYCP